LKQGRNGLRVFVAAWLVCAGHLAFGQSLPPTALKVLYRFTAADETVPSGQLVQGADGSLYGVLQGGGQYGQGSVFKLDPAGHFATLHSFGSTGLSCDSLDGAYPYTGVIFGPDGNLYGTTTEGGANGGGTIYRMTPQGQVTPLVAFGGAPPAGSRPSAPLSIGSDGSIYGTTDHGGTVGLGTAFRLSLSGSLTVLHNFPSDGTEGGGLRGALTPLPDGTVYGTTSIGGNHPGGGDGTIFMILPDGTFQVLHYFPYTATNTIFGLALGPDGTLYGATQLGGANGTLFSITSDGFFGDIYDFGCSCGTQDGAQPAGPMTLGSDGYLYGITSFGGASNNGTMFRTTTSGVVVPLHAFTSAEGGAPAGGLLEGADGRFYGMTSAAFTHDPSIIYSLALPPSATPAGLSAVAGDGKVGLTWSAVKGASSYDVYQATSSGVETAPAALSALTETSATLSGLQNGTRYYFTVVATNEGGAGRHSAEMSAMPVAAPTDSKATSGTQSITLSWSAAAGAASYSVYEGDSPEIEAAGLIASGLTTTSFTVTGLAAGKTYYFRVASVSGPTLVMSIDEVSGALPAASTAGSTGSSGGGGALDIWVLLGLGLVLLRSSISSAAFSRGLVIASVAVAALSTTGCGGGGGNPSPGPPSGYTVGGSVSGLPAGLSLVVQNNASDSITVSSNSPFTFPTAIATGGKYNVTVVTQLSGQDCAVTDGTGTIGAANVSSVAIECTPSTYLVGGTISGLAAGTSLTLTDNGIDATSISANGNFAFAVKISSGSGYSVIVATQPSGQTCVVGGAAGTVTTSDVESMTVTCTPTVYTVSGTVTGLATGVSVVLMNNGVDSVTVSRNSQFTFPISLASGSDFLVTIGTQPLYQTCSVENASGTVVGAGVTNIVVRCPYVSTVWEFGYGAADGQDPQAGMIRGADGNFYGTTEYGGNDLGGTVFKYTPTASEKYAPMGNVATITDFAFASNPQGSQGPVATVLQSNDGNFYGTTYAGGTHNAGTVFKVTPSGLKTVLWSFGGGNDGGYPKAALIQASDGNLYGTTSSGGTFGYGAVFKITPAGAESVLWNFGGGSDGSYPEAGVVQGSDGSFYGSTSLGGTQGFGTVFRITPAGVETVLVNFDYTNGTEPKSGVILASDGNFYGTTAGGGTAGGGVAFKVTLAGDLSIIWNFGAGNDAEGPWSGLIQGRDGNFYGTSVAGGTIRNSSVSGCGTVFRLTPDGVETVLWDFGYGGNGATLFPFSLVEDADGNFYGTNWIGGNTARGTIFKLIL
jgi:uncharacterized repeat protein (TIGR03803 family)